MRPRLETVSWLRVARGTSKTWREGVSFSFIWNGGFACWCPVKGEDILEGLWCLEKDGGGRRLFSGGTPICKRNSRNSDWEGYSLLLFLFGFCFLVFFFFFCLHSMQDLSSSTRDQTHTPCTGNLVSQLPDGQRSLRRPLFWGLVCKIAWHPWGTLYSSPVRTLPL